MADNILLLAIRERRSSCKDTQLTPLYGILSHIRDQKGSSQRKVIPGDWSRSTSDARTHLIEIESLYGVDEMRLISKCIKRLVFTLLVYRVANISGILSPSARKSHSVVVKAYFKESPLGEICTMCDQYQC